MLSHKRVSVGWVFLDMKELICVLCGRSRRIILSLVSVYRDAAVASCMNIVDTQYRCPVICAMHGGTSPARTAQHTVIS